MRWTKKYIILFLIIGHLVSCKSEPVAKETPVEENVLPITTPVTLTYPFKGSMIESVELNAISSFLLKTYVKSSANGYLQLVNAEIGKYVTKGQDLFIIKTKEAQSLGNTINSLDSSLHFEGVIHIKSPGTGYISQLNYRTGDYVQDGEQMAAITDTKSFVFILELPYELKPYLPRNREIQLKLPDSTFLNGHIEMALPTVDPVSQTQHYIIKIATEKQIPENLIAKMSLIKKSKSNTISLLKAAVLTDEVQSQFWIMKMVDSTTAIKVLIKKGIETADKIEILFPTFTSKDKILLTGNYGLPDTAKVAVIK